MGSELGRHVRDNLWLWTAVAIIGTGVALLLRTLMGGGYHLGDLAALLGMLAGTFIMMRADVGRVVPDLEEEEEA